MLLLEKMMVDLDKENRERGQEGEERQSKRGRGVWATRATGV